LDETYRPSLPKLTTPIEVLYVAQLSSMAALSTADVSQLETDFDAAHRAET
jgi:hypothetical protein